MEENLILEGLLSMVTELKEKQEAQVTPAGREETLSRLEAIERALSELRRNPAVPEKELRDILTRLADLRKSGAGTAAVLRGGQRNMWSPPSAASRKCWKQWKRYRA